MLTAMRSPNCSTLGYRRPMHMALTAAPQPPPWGLNGIMKPSELHGYSIVNDYMQVLPGSRPSISDMQFLYSLASFMISSCLSSECPCATRASAVAMCTTLSSLIVHWGSVTLISFFPRDAEVPYGSQFLSCRTRSVRFWSRAHPLHRLEPWLQCISSVFADPTSTHVFSSILSAISTF